MQGLTNDAQADFGSASSFPAAVSRRSAPLRDGVKTANLDQKAGVDIVRRAIQVPARQIVQNAGEDGSLVVGKLLENASYNWGFNAATGEYQDLVKAGVIDPAKVVRTALASALTLLSLADCGMDSSPKQAAAKTGDMLPLPPIRYLDSMPWMNWNTSAPTLRIDTLMSPTVTPWGILQIPQDRAKASTTFS